MSLLSLMLHPQTTPTAVRGTMPSTDSADNYSGHFVDSYFDKKRFIVAEGPQESTSAKFWQVVWDEDCSLVVMLTPQDSELVSWDTHRDRYLKVTIFFFLRVLTFDISVVLHKIIIVHT